MIGNNTMKRAAVALLIVVTALSGPAAPAQADRSGDPIQCTQAPCGPPPFPTDPCKDAVVSATVPLVAQLVEAEELLVVAEERIARRDAKIARKDAKIAELRAVIRDLRDRA